MYGPPFPQLTDWVEANKASPRGALLSEYLYNVRYHFSHADHALLDASHALDGFWWFSGPEPNALRLVFEGMRSRGEGTQGQSRWATRQGSADYDPSSINRSLTRGTQKGGLVRGTVDPGGRPRDCHDLAATPNLGRCG